MQWGEGFPWKRHLGAQSGIGRLDFGLTLQSLLGEAPHWQGGPLAPVVVVESLSRV